MVIAISNVRMQPFRSQQLPQDMQIAFLEAYQPRRGEKSTHFAGKESGGISRAKWPVYCWWNTFMMFKVYPTYEVG